MRPRAMALLIALCVVGSVVAAVWTHSAQHHTQHHMMMPVTVDGKRVELAVRIATPEGPGPFPTLIFHHGSTGGGTDPSTFATPYFPKPLVDWFTERGWAVILPSRRGRGGSEGLYDEGFSPDRAQGYTCDAERLLAGAMRGLRDIEAITPEILALPFIDRQQVVVGGHSRGGTLAVLWASRHPGSARAVLNFSGGWRSTSCATATEVNQALFDDDPSRTPPALWIYGEDDSLLPLPHSRANFDAFRARGGDARFVAFDPPSGINGHQIVDLPPLWQGAVSKFLGDHGLALDGGLSGPKQARTH